jgi:Na+/melibiose symporter-like transporter
VPSPLQSARLRRILAAYTINRFGTWFGLVALSVAVFDHTHSAIAVAALLISGQVLPAFLAPAVVARIEASEHRAQLSGLYVVEGVTTLALATLVWHFWLPAVLLLVALDGTAGLAANALLRAAAARAAWEHVAKSKGIRTADNGAEIEGHVAERKANAALNVAFSGTFVLGPAIAGVIVASAGAPTALLVDAASFLVCAAMLTDLRPHIDELGEASVRARLRAAWQHINDVPALRALLLAQALALVFFEFSGPIEIAYAKVTLHVGDRGYGLLLGAWGVGVVAGSVVFARSLHRSLTMLLSAGTFGVGLAYVGFAGAPSLSLACIAAVIGGVGNGVQWASMISAVQKLTPQRLQGRMMGAVESLGALCPAIGLTLGGFLVALASPRVAFLVAGLGATATTALFLRVRLGEGARASAGDSEATVNAGQLLEPRPHEPASIPRTGPIENQSTEVRPASSTTP